MLIGSTKAYGRISPQQYCEQLAAYLGQNPETAGCYAKQIPVPGSVSDTMEV